MIRLALFVGVLVSMVSAQSCAGVVSRFTPEMASGYTVQLVMNDLKAPRDMIFDKLGNMLVAEQGGAGVRYIKLIEMGGAVCVGSSKTLIADPSVSCATLQHQHCYPVAVPDSLRPSSTTVLTSRQTARL